MESTCGPASQLSHRRGMRPCFLIIDNEYPESISTRKLVIETAKMNVITCYSPKEGIETLARFPHVDGIVLDSEIRGTSCEEFVKQLRAMRRDLPIVIISPGGDRKCDDETHHIRSYDPKQLLELLQKLRPVESREIVRHDEQIGRKTPEQKLKDHDAG